MSVSAAIIDDRGRVLVIRRADNGQWEPPGGILELGESIHTASSARCERRPDLTSRRSL